jgi:hypothetical protein
MKHRRAAEMAFGLFAIGGLFQELDCRIQGHPTWHMVMFATMGAVFSALWLWCNSGHAAPAHPGQVGAKDLGAKSSIPSFGVGR